MIMIEKTERTTPSRYANQRATYDENILYAILDEALFCTVSYAEENQPFSIPQSFVRVDNHIYLHGFVGSHFIRTLADGRPACISVMLADEIVVAKTAVHHSINYRSVVIFAEGEIVEDQDLKYLAFKKLTEKMVPDSWDYLKPMNKKEMDKTTAVRFSLKEASAKLRQGPIPDTYGQGIPLPAHLNY